MSDKPHISIFRPDAQRIADFLEKAGHPVGTKVISEKLDLPYTSTMYHLKYLLELGAVNRYRMHKQRGYFFSPADVNYAESALHDVIEVNGAPNVPTSQKKSIESHYLKKRGIKAPEPVLAAPTVFWPYTKRYMTIAEILIFESQESNRLGKDYKRGPIIATAFNACKKAVQVMDKSEFSETLSALKTQKAIIEAHVRAFDDLIKAYKTAGDPETLHRMTVQEDTTFEDTELADAMGNSSLIWNSAELGQMNKYPMYWLMGLFKVNWLTPVSVEEIMRILPLKREVVELTLKTSLNGDFPMFKEEKAGRISKWRYMFPEYEMNISTNAARLIRDKRLIEHVFGIESFDVDGRR